MRLEGGTQDIAITDPKHPQWPYTCTNCCNRFKERLKLCAQCHTRHYCSAACQKYDWPVHKATECLVKKK